MLVYYKVGAQQTLHIWCALSRMSVYWSWPKDLLGYLAYRKPDHYFSHSPDQAEGYLDYLQTLCELIIFLK
jgi:hypothetical protein